MWYRRQHFVRLHTLHGHHCISGEIWIILILMILCGYIVHIYINLFHWRDFKWKFYNRCPFLFRTACASYVLHCRAYDYDVSNATFSQPCLCHNRHRLKQFIGCCISVRQRSHWSRGISFLFEKLKKSTAKAKCHCHIILKRDLYIHVTIKC